MLVDYPESDEDSDRPSDREINSTDAEQPRAGDQSSKAANETHVPSAPLPSLPVAFHSLYASNVRISTSDDPTLHGGRKRQLPHVRGNWPAHVYLEWFLSKQELEHIEGLISEVKSINFSSPSSNHIRIHSFLRSHLNVLLPLHVSLSAPLILETEQKESFLNLISESLYNAKISGFKVNISHLDWVSNCDKSRFFLVLKLDKPANDELNRLLMECNSCAAKLSLSQLYHNNNARSTSHLTQEQGVESLPDLTGAFHISIAWSLDEPSKSSRQAIQSLVTTKLEMVEIPFDTVKVKIGNEINDIALMKS